MLRLPFAQRLLLLFVVACPLVGCEEAAVNLPDAASTGGSSISAEGLLESATAGLFSDNLQDLTRVTPQIREQLNNWLKQEPADPDWKPDPIVEQLPDDIKNGPVVSNLTADRFTEADIQTLLEVIALRDISRRAKGDALEEVAVATRIFDWLTRNLQLEVPNQLGQRWYRRPQEILTLGRATAEEKAWLFTLLCRQQKLSAAMLEILLPTKEGEPAAAYWLCGLWLDSKLYLFDPQMGLPLSPQLDAPPLTWDVLTADADALKQFDLDGKTPYPVTVEVLKSATVWLDTSLVALAKRFQKLENALVGEHQVVLRFRASELAARMAAAGLPAAKPSIRPLMSMMVVAPRSELQMYILKQFLPFNMPVPRSEKMRVTRARPDAGTEGEAQNIRSDETELLRSMETLTPLGTGRAQEIRGRFKGVNGAQALYLLARPSDAEIDNLVSSAPNRELEIETRVNYKRMRQTATYWLGLVAAELSDAETATDFLKGRVLETGPDNPWSAGARYNLARAYETQGKLAEAAATLAEDKTSPQSYGNRLRATRLAALKQPPAVPGVGAAN